jgi:hypothetical protein
VVLRDMKVSPEDVRTRLDAWRGVGACTASCFMASRALSRGARTNGAVCAAPGGSRHHLYHRLFVFGGEKRGAKLGQDESSSSDALEQDETGFGCDGVYERMQEKRADSAWRVHSQGLPMMLMLVLLVLTVADTLLEQAVPRGGVVELSASHLQGMGGLWIERVLRN